MNNDDNQFRISFAIGAHSKFKHRRPRVTMNNQKPIKMNAKEINLAVTSNHDIFLVNA